MFAINPSLSAQNSSSAITESELDQMIGDSIGFFEQGNYEEAVKLAINAAQKAENSFGQLSPFTLSAIFNLARTYSGVQDYEQATKVYKKALSIATEMLGEDHAETLMVTEELGLTYGDSGDYNRALEMLEKVFLAKKKSIGINNPEILHNVNNLAQMYLAKGQWRKAEAVLKEALSSLGSLSIQDVPELLFSKDILASTYIAGGDYPQAETILNDVLEIKRQNLGDKDVETLVTMSSLAELYRLMGQYKKSEPLFNDAVRLMRQTLGDMNPDLYQTISNLAILYEDIGKYDQAEELYKKVYEYDKQSLGETHPNTIVDLDKIAGLYRRKGDYGLSEMTYRKALSQVEAALGKYHPQAVNIMNNLALLNENQGYYEQAEPLFKEALTVSRKANGEKHPSTLAIMNNIAMLFESQGSFKKSEPLYNQTIEFSQEIFGDNHPNTIASVNNLGYLFLMEREFDLAEPMFSQVLDVWKSQLGLKHQKTLKALNNLARVKHYKGDLVAAEEMFTQSLKLRKEVLGDRHPDVVRSQIDMSGLLISEEKFSEAEKLLTETLQLSDEVLGDKHQYSFEALNNLSDALEFGEKTSEAYENRKRGFQRRSDFFDRVLWATGENTRENYITLHKHEQDKYLKLLLKVNSPETAKSALDVSLQRKGLLLKIASEIQKVLEMTKSPELSSLAKKLNETRKELASLTLSGPVGETPEEFQKKLVDLEEEVNDLQALLGQKSMPFRTASQWVSVDQLFEQLNEEDVLIDYLTYVDGTPKIFAMVAKKSTSECFLVFDCKNDEIKLIPLGELEEVRKFVSFFREVIQDEYATDADFEEAAKDIYNLVWKPIVPHLANRKSVYLVPDSILHLLPFDAILDEDGKYLIETLDLKVISSGRDIVIPALPPSSGEFVILAGPDYDLDSETNKVAKQIAKGRRSAATNALKVQSHGLRSLSFDPLLGAELEGEAIQKVSKSAQGVSRIYSKKTAEEQLLRSIDKPPGMLHIATHGFFLQAEERLKSRLLSMQRGGPQKLPPPGDNPLLRAGLAFAGINTNAPFLGDIDTNNDGVLTALEVLNLKLSGTRLVVLSACETGVGEIHAGEGVYGLRRSFQEAGVISVINSLWPVSDEGTRLLMTGFYDRIYKKIPTREALKQSQMELIKSEDWNHPYYWAAFVMVDKPNK
ncbi:MAG: tetratricopeptide repeat protein [Deltaproteobacteria bacterium]|nr:tetratricopeptide repeat protein [Deltaproteobacteria bacterium]